MLTKLSSKTLMAAAAVAGVLATATPIAIAAAQTAAPAAAAQTRPARPNPPLPGERIDAQLAYLKTALKITPPQEGAWANLAAILRRQAEARDTEMKAMRDARANRTAPTGDAMTRLTERQKSMVTRASALNDILTAAKPLYVTMSDEQKQTADRMLNRSGFDRGGSRGHFSRFR